MRDDFLLMVLIVYLFNIKILQIENIAKFDTFSKQPPCTNFEIFSKFKNFVF